jgi:toluene monooxygenase system ferredoxin subunit
MSTVLERSAEALSVLGEAAFFRDLDDAQRRAVLALSEIEERDAGEHFYRIGEPAQNFYVLMSGIVRLNIALDQRHASAGDILRRGQVFGWAALTPSANQRIATAACVTSASVLTIDGAGLVALMDRDHTLGYQLMRQLVLLVTGTLTACAAG